MKKLLFLILISSIFDCSPIDIEDDVLVEKRYYLNGAIDDQPFEITAGENDILLDSQWEFTAPRHRRSTFRKTFVCTNNCEGFFELLYFWPNGVNEFDSTFEQKYPNSIYEFTNIDSSESNKFVVTYQDELGNTYTSDFSADNSAHQFELIQHFPDENKTEVKFSCNLINSAGAIIQLRNFSGFVIL